eukprot:TRINITY_DN8974_c0_g1_i3.p1 TRINITY_DN8974_c0_g1~~TRINITY_DN8974_c0_g1_i3.p1  ORF type:complete len:444 (+),score=98.24 TRINITY_DN8974_c0_g1_i3:765-2096(+)
MGQCCTCAAWKRRRRAADASEYEELFTETRRVVLPPTELYSVEELGSPVQFVWAPSDALPAKYAANGGGGEGKRPFCVAYRNGFIGHFLWSADVIECVGAWKAHASHITALIAVRVPGEDASVLWSGDDEGIVCVWKLDMDGFYYLARELIAFAKHKGKTFAVSDLCLVDSTMDEGGVSHVHELEEEEAVGDVLSVWACSAHSSEIRMFHSMSHRPLGMVQLEGGSGCSHLSQLCDDVWGCGSSSTAIVFAAQRAVGVQFSSHTGNALRCAVDAENRRLWLIPDNGVMMVWRMMDGELLCEAMHAGVHLSAPSALHCHNGVMWTASDKGSIVLMHSQLSKPIADVSVEGHGGVVAIEHVSGRVLALFSDHSLVEWEQVEGTSIAPLAPYSTPPAAGESSGSAATSAASASVFGARAGSKQWLTQRHTERGDTLIGRRSTNFTG